MPRRKNNALPKKKKQNVHSITSVAPKSAAPLERMLTSKSEITTVVRNTALSTFTGSIAVDVSGGYYFRLSDLPGYAELTALFDSYRIREIEIEMLPAINNTLASTFIGDPRVYTAIDYDSGSSVTLAQIKEYATCRVDDSRVGFKRRFRPRVALATYGGGAFTSYATAPEDQWIDAASPSVEHYGFLMVLPANTNNYQICYLTAKFVVELMKVR